MNEPLIKKDCFAYYGSLRRCSILTEVVCSKRKCSFYKTREQYESDRQKYDAIVAAKLNA